MNVVLVEPFGHLAGHASPYTFKLTKALLQLGHDVHLVSAAGFRDDWPTSLGVRHISALGPEGLKPGKGLLWAAQRATEHFRVHQRAFQLASELPNSVVHIIDFNPITLLAARLLMRRSTPVITLGGVGSNSTPTERRHQSLSKTVRQYPSALYNRVLRKRILRSALNRAEVVVHSQLVGARAKRLGVAERPALIPWGTDRRQPRSTREAARDFLGIPLEARVGIAFGPLRPDKGLELLIQAVSQLPERMVHILVAGRRLPGTVDPIALAETLQCVSNFTFRLEWIPEGECDLLFTAADFVALPYLNGFEGDSGVLSYACEYGLPVISSDAGELGSRVTTHGLGLVFQAGNADQLAASLQQFAALSPTELNELRCHCERYTASNSWHAVAQQHTIVYENALNNERCN